MSIFEKQDQERRTAVGEIIDKMFQRIEPLVQQHTYDIQTLMAFIEPYIILLKCEIQTNNRHRPFMYRAKEGAQMGMAEVEVYTCDNDRFVYVFRLGWKQV